MSKILNTIERKLDAILKKCKCKSQIEPPLILTNFLSNSSPSEDDPCATSPAEIDFLGTYYHTGEGNAVNGETVYSDETGDTLLTDGLYSYAGQFWFYVSEGIANTDISCL